MSLFDPSTDVPIASALVCFEGEQRKWRGLAAMSQFDPSETFNFGRSVPSTTPYARLNTFLALVTADDGRVLFAHLGDNPVLNGGSRRFCYSRARGDV
jgi:hypothetical protein